MLAAHYGRMILRVIMHGVAWCVFKVPSGGDVYAYKQTYRVGVTSQQDMCIADIWATKSTRTMGVLFRVKNESSYVQTWIRDGRIMGGILWMSFGLSEIHCSTCSMRHWLGSWPLLFFLRLPCWQHVAGVLHWEWSCAVPHDVFSKYILVVRVMTLTILCLNNRKSKLSP